MKKAGLLRGVWHLKAPHQETVSYFFKAERFSISAEESKLDGQTMPHDFFWSFVTYVFLSYGFNAESETALYVDHEERWRSSLVFVVQMLEESNRFPQEPFQKIAHGFKRLTAFQLPFAGENAPLWQDYPHMLLSEANLQKRDVQSFNIEILENFLHSPELGIVPLWVEPEEWEKSLGQAKRLQVLL